MPDANELFRGELEAAGLRPSEIIADGKLHRCPVEGKPGAKDGAYVLHLDDPPAGWWQNHRAGTEGRWTAGNNGTKPSEDQIREREATRQRRETEKEASHAEAAQRARKLLAEAQPCADHEYLKRKGVQTCPGLKVATGGLLLVPVLGPDGQAQSVQTIGADGAKLFMTGGRMFGGYFAINGDEGLLWVCEGLATGLSLHEATGHTVLVAFTAGNLEAVARMAREKYPEREIILAGDDDRQTDGNPGATKARAAALAVGGKLALPVFAKEGAGTDFNDLHQAEGLEAVKSQVDHAETPQAEPAAPPAGEQERRPHAWPFKLDGHGVWFLAEDSNGNTEWQWVCSPLVVLSRTRDAQGEDWGRLLHVKDADGNWHTWAMPMSLTSGNGDEYRARLKSLGLDLAPGRKGKERLELYLTTARPQARARCVNRVGWSAAAFILPDTPFGDTRGETVVFQAPAVHDHAFRISGSLEEWQEHLARFCVGNSRLAFAVSLAFAAPMLNLVGAESGGFHLVGASSTGKTTALRVAGSVWGGGGVSGYIRTWRATSNGLEAVGLAHCDTLICLDEMSQVEAKEAGEVAYMLANGQGKSRARRDGAGRPPAQWRAMFLSTGEVALADKLMEAGKRVRAGQEVRLVDVPAEAAAGLGLFEDLHGFPAAADLADHLRQGCQTYFGSPIRSFLLLLTSKLEEASQKVKGDLQDFVAKHCPPEADGQVKRVAARFGLVAASGELAVSLGVLPWPCGEATLASAKCFRDWLASRGNTGPAEIEVAISEIAHYLEHFGSTARFPRIGGEFDEIMDQASVEVIGYRKQIGEGGFDYLVRPETLKRTILRGRIPSGLNMALVDRKLVEPDAKGAATKLERLPPDNKPKRVYRLNNNIFGVGSGEGGVE